FPTLGLVFFFHTVLQPPSTTLVPYTTLFRSGLAGLPPALRRTGAQRFIDQRLVLALGVDELAEARLAARDVEQEHGRMRELLRRAEARERGGRVAAFIELEPLVAELQRAGGGLRRGVRRASHGRQRQRGARHAATRAGERQ